MASPSPETRDLTFQPSGFRAPVPGPAVARAERYGSGMMDKGELQFLAAVALAFPWTEGGFVVEIGTFTGLTAAFVAETLAEAGHRVPVLSIDPFERVRRSRGNPQGRYKRYLRTMRDRGLEDMCFPLVGFSQDVAGVVPDRAGLLIVDGNHDLESVERDLALYALKVLPGGFVFLDDYTDTYPGVKQATDAFVASQPRFSLLHRSYFAVLQREA